ncbi:hypothetical protein GDO81_002825 [Engystomops pustulosus]|uniref:Uncharacterized protein n=1 Tax=Engystomops pustulosus TaxID=76066 RepID=A0AAV7DSN3_ENGPU|nr:hypothetical protein GDO81_002825 [Engystomops pustulosus]
MQTVRDHLLYDQLLEKGLVPGWDFIYTVNAEIDCTEVSQRIILCLFIARYKVGIGSFLYISWSPFILVGWIVCPFSFYLYGTTTRGS